jgi:hypothetical protein
MKPTETTPPRLSLLVAIACATQWLLAAPPPWGSTVQDPAAVNADTIRVVLENEQVHVLEARLAPGHKEELHSHPAHVTYVVSGGRVRMHCADGTISETSLETGAVLYREPAR